MGPGATALPAPLSTPLVITMIWLTSCRLYAVIRPFKSSTQPRTKAVCLMIPSSWCIGLLMALIPVLPILSGIFVTHALLEHTEYLDGVPTALNQSRELFNTLLTSDLKPNVTIPANFHVEDITWDNLDLYAQEFFVHDHFNVKRLFGYYSVNSVCIPNFYATKSEGNWPYSLMVNIFNFCAFTYVVSAYAAIYMKALQRSNMRASSSKSDNKEAQKLQRKILRLIATDFCCWIPICIMAFAKIAGAEISSIAYAVSAVVLLPINSSLNPLLYSNIPDIVYDNISKCCNRHQEEDVKRECTTTTSKLRTSSKGQAHEDYKETLM